MPGYVCLLRGINVSGHKLIKMDRLRASCEALGLEEVRTYVQSGNIVFKAAAKQPEVLVSAIHKKILVDFGFEVPVTVLTDQELNGALRDNPFLAEKDIDPATLHVTFLSAKPAAAAVKKLEAVSAGVDRFRLVGNRVYLHCPGGYGRTKFSNQAIERLLGVTATTRNWKTVNELARMA